MAVVLCLFYIHKNPIRAGIVDRLSVYPWSNYHAYSGVKDLPWLETSVVLSVYCDRKGFIEAQKEYAKEGDCLRNFDIAFSWEARPLRQDLRID